MRIRATAERRSLLKASRAGGWLVVAFAVLIGLDACGPQVLQLGHSEYPSEYPVARSSGACPDLNGTFENTGTVLNLSHDASAPHARDPMLSTVMLAPGLVPSDTQVIRVKIGGPAEGHLEITALSADKTVAQVNMPSAQKADAFIHSKPYSSFLCDSRFGPNVIFTTEPHQTGGGNEEAVRIYRASDGSLIVGREFVHSYLGVNDVWRYWLRFRPVEADKVEGTKR